MHFIQYLKKVPSLEILYKPNEHIRVKGFIDVDWASFSSDGRSTIDFCTFQDDSLVY